MERYDSYKDSGVEWIGEIPRHWERFRLRNLGSLYGGLTGKSGDDFKQDDNPLNRPYIPYTNIFKNTYISKDHVDFVVMEEGERQNRVQRYDLFFLMSSENYDDLGKPCVLIDDVEELYLNSFCKGFRVRQNIVNPLFLNYQLLGDTHRKLVSIEGKGFTRINLRQDRLTETPMIIPPVDEQERIVEYLDRKTALIDSLIEKTGRKIELLKEKRTSLINEVVTKGLDPDVEMKDSGVEWIGEIPKHWAVKRLQWLSDIENSGVWGADDRFEGATEVPIPTTAQLSIDGRWNYEGMAIRYLSIEERDKYICKVGDIVVVKSSGSATNIITGKCGFINEEDDGKFGFSNFLMRVRTNNTFHSRLTYYFLQSNITKQRIERMVSATTYPNLKVDEYVKSDLLVPPVDEQERIVEYLDEQTAIIDSTITKEEKRIELLKEYRQSLISEVVTGKVKVA